MRRSLFLITFIRIKSQQRIIIILLMSSAQTFRFVPTFIHVHANVCAGARVYFFRFDGGSDGGDGGGDASYQRR